MGFPFHTLEMDNTAGLAFTDKVLCYTANALANVAGATNAAITTAVSFTGQLPSTYAVQVTPSQACFVSVTSKAVTGFNVVLTPTSGSTSISAGTFDVIVFG